MPSLEAKRVRAKRGTGRMLHHCRLDPDKGGQSQRVGDASAGALIVLFWDGAPMPQKTAKFNPDVD